MRVFKGKYFHETDFLAARKKRNSSHVWRAMLHGREALYKGLIKRVGDGSSIHAFEDPWIPANMNGRPLFKLPTANVTMVEELIDNELLCWDEGKLEVNFIETDRKAICQIPLGRTAEDSWAWTQEKSGVFSVQSPYRLLASVQQANYPSGSADSNCCWKNLWKLTVPPKVRSFWWRVIRKFVPARQVLKQRHMDRIAFCEAWERRNQFTTPCLSALGLVYFGLI